MAQRSKGYPTSRAGNLPPPKIQRRQTADIARDCDASVQQLAAKVSAAIFIYRETKSLFINPAAETLTGYARKELLKLAFPEIFHPDCRELLLKKSANRTKSEKDRQPCEVRIIRKDGEERWADFSADTITFRGAKATIATLIDITGKRQAEALKEWKTKEVHAHNLLTAAISQSLNLDSVVQEAVRSIVDLYHLDGAWIYLFNESLDGLYLRASNQAELSLLSPVYQVHAGQGIVGSVAKTGELLILEDIQSDPRYDRISRSGSAKRAGARFFAAFPIQSKLKFWGVLTCLGKESRRLTVEEVDLLVTLSNEVAIAIENATLYEHTAQKAKELSALYTVAGVAAEYVEVSTLMHHSLQKIQNIFGFTAGRVYVVDEEKGEILLAHQNGFPADLSLPTRYRRGEGLIGKIAESGQPLTFEDMQNDLEYHRQAQAKVLLQAGFRASFFIPLRVRGETLGVMNLVSNEPHSFTPGEHQLINAIAYHLGIAIGNARTLSRLTRRTRDLETANKTKDEFLSVMSHELRTPLNVIMGYTQLMQDGTFGNISGDLEHAVNTISEQTECLLSMIEKIFLVTQLETGAVKINRAEIDMGRLFADLKRSYTMPAQDNIHIVWDIPSDLPAVTTDGEKLKTVLRHLIDNALKFTENGRILISAGPVPGQNAVRVWVEDTGIGIREDMLPAVFEKFRQLDSSDTRAHGGVGLGLYIVKKLSDLLGGTIFVRSEVGKGTTIAVTIPLTRL